MEPKEKKYLRRIIQELFYTKKSLMKADNPNNSLAYLAGLLRHEYLYQNLDKNLFRDFMTELYCYARDRCVFEESRSHELAKLQNYFVQKSKPIKKFLASLDEKHPKDIELEEIQEILQAFEKGTYTDKTIMEYTLWILNFAFEEPALDKAIQYIPRIFEVYLRDYLVPREEKPLSSPFSPLIQYLDDILEEYIEKTQPSYLFMKSLQTI